MSMYMTDTFCSFTRCVIFKGCFLFSEYDSTASGCLGLYSLGDNVVVACLNRESFDSLEWVISCLLSVGAIKIL